MLEFSCLLPFEKVLDGIYLGFRSSGPGALSFKSGGMNNVVLKQQPTLESRCVKSLHIWWKFRITRSMGWLEETSNSYKMHQISCMKYLVIISRVFICLSHQPQLKEIESHKYSDIQHQIWSMTLKSDMTPIIDILLVQVNQISKRHSLSSFGDVGKHCNEWFPWGNDSSSGLTLRTFGPLKYAFIAWYSAFHGFRISWQRIRTSFFYERF